ncbi:MAG: Fe-S cluster assembly protein HesB [Opitutaceae bacterium]|nr:Fe-S cluster assembly protein HesB [Opitutaceae bacterium]
MDASTLTRQAETFRTELITWYDANQRDLPWRDEPSLYKTVVSEFMLQQTQVKTVLPYFEKWILAYPSFSALAEASENQVLKSWEGLGYYSRARNLHKLAQAIASLEKIPRNAKSWLAFPGIGPYSAAAICSIAFAEREAVVDGNVVRILARLVADKNQFKSTVDAAKAYREVAQTLINRDRPGDHNQAMMELGATVCLKHSPQCLLCPVSKLCEGQSKGIESELPRFQKRKTEKQTISRAWVVGDQGILVHRIPNSANRMKGLHEIPTCQQLNINVGGGVPLLERKRSITKYRITERFHKFEPSIIDLPKLGPNFLWVQPQEIEDLPFSGPHRKWIAELLEMEG